MDYLFPYPYEPNEVTDAPDGEGVWTRLFLESTM